MMYIKKSFITVGFFQASICISSVWKGINCDFYKHKLKWHIIFVWFIVDPPSPVPCPVGGRYSFIQNFRTVLEKYQTRIRGVTEKPRVQVPCRNWVTEFKSCSDTMTRVDIDAEYCESVDYRGRPIGEYGECS